MTHRFSKNVLFTLATLLAAVVLPVQWLSAVEASSDRSEPVPAPQRNQSLTTASTPVLVLGQVHAAGPYTPERGLRILDVIRMAGGFTGAAKSNEVQVVRKSSDGTRTTIIVDCNAPLNERAAERPNGLFPIQPGDKVFVPEAPR